MMKLKLSEWASLAEIVTSVVVILSLVYVGMEVSQNTKALHQASYQAGNDYLLQLDIAQASNEDLNRVMMLAETSPADTTREEWERFSKMAYSRYGLWEFMYLAVQDDAIAETQWVVFEPFFLETACEPGYLRFFQENIGGFSPSFQEYVASRVVPNCS